MIRSYAAKSHGTQAQTLKNRLLSAPAKSNEKNEISVQIVPRAQVSVFDSAVQVAGPGLFLPELPRTLRELCNERARPSKRSAETILPAQDSTATQRRRRTFSVVLVRRSLAAAAEQKRSRPSTLKCRSTYRDHSTIPSTQYRALVCTLAPYRSLPRTYHSTIPSTGTQYRPSCTTRILVSRYLTPPRFFLCVCMNRNPRPGPSSRL